MNLGSLLRQRRKDKGFTLKDVAVRAGLSEGFLSQVENNVKAPSVPNLMKVCEALDAEIGPLFEDLKNQQSLFVVRREEWDDTDVPHTGFATRRFCPPESRSVIDSAILILEPGKSLPVRKGVKSGQEVLTVLQGRLQLLHGSEDVRLFEGDSIHMWTEPRRQSITNTGDSTAVVLWVGTL